MDTISRRRFLIASGVTGATALVAGATAVTMSQLTDSAASNPLPAGEPVLVVVTLYGGNDGLNTLVPYADSAYHDLRPELAYDPADVLHLDGELALNPAMKGFAKLWQSKQLAIVRGVGYPQPDHSHFRSMDIWQTASPAAPVKTGWIGRWLDATGDDPVRAVNLGSVLPPLTVGAKSTAAALSVGQAKRLPAQLTSALAGLGKNDPSDGATSAMVCAAYRGERTVAATFDPVLGAQPAAAEGGDSVKAQLDVVAKCIKAGVPTKVYSVSLDGFDTHAGEKATQASLLGELDGALSAFLADMAQVERGRGVSVLVYSEFGRRVAANASLGTDHGTAGPVFVAGVPVLGGFYGEQPSLTDLDNGDLKSNVDFRAVYGELVHKVLGSDPAQVLDTVPAELGFLR
ncbi:MAG: DUF1501 domain-containing protein [Pseudonocardiales bacterium]